MDLATVLVEVDDADACAARVRLAAELALTNGSHLIGLYVRHDLRIPTPGEIRNGSGLLERQLEHTGELERLAEAVFRDAAAAVGNADWRVLDGPRHEVVPAHCRYVDLAVVAVDTQSPRALQVADETAMESGRPVLMIPQSWRKNTLGTRVMIAWNNSREAARAMNDALPLLRRASAVKAIAIATVGRPHVGNVDSVCRHLERHGIEASAERFETDSRNEGSLLLDAAARFDADLVVMGAYGHTRLREVVLGGVTDHVLSHMTIPVLMSH